MKADDFFNALFASGKAARFDWKNTHPKTTHYSPIVKINGKFFIIDIIVKNGEHLISDNIVQQFCKFHGFSV